MGGPAVRVCHVGARLPVQQVRTRKYANVCDRLIPNVVCSELIGTAQQHVAVTAGTSWIPAPNAQAKSSSCYPVEMSALIADCVVSAASADASADADKASMQNGATPQQSATPAFITGWDAWSGQSPRPRVESFA